MLAAAAANTQWFPDTGLVSSAGNLAKFGTRFLNVLQLEINIKPDEMPGPWSGKIRSQKKITCFFPPAFSVAATLKT